MSDSYRSTPAFAVGGVAWLPAKGREIYISDPTPTGWRCFHCNEHFNHWRAALRHFGMPADKRDPACLRPGYKPQHTTSMPQGAQG